MLLTGPCVLLLFLVGRSVSQGQYDEQTGKQANLLKYKNENYGADGYEFYYETDDGTVREEKGSFVEGIWTVVGKSAWMDPNGKIYITEYTADDKGYIVHLSEMFQAYPKPTISLRPSYPAAGPSPPQLSKGSLASLVEINGLLEPTAKRKFMKIKMRP